MREKKNQKEEQKLAQDTECLAQLITFTMAVNATQNSAFVQDPPPTMINLEPGHAVGRCNTVCIANASKEKPSIYCPLFACASFWLFVISSLLYYLYAREARENCVKNGTWPGPFGPIKD